MNYTFQEPERRELCHQRDKEFPLQMKPTFLANKKWLPYVLDLIIIAIIVFYGNFEGSQFIYFQF